MYRKKPYWENPWKNSCIVLGSSTIRDFTGDEPKTINYDLYALPSSNPRDISFGARFSNEPSDYESGSAYFSDGEWDIVAGRYTALAAALYFANHHYKNKK